MVLDLDAILKLIAPLITGTFGLLIKIYSDAKPKLVTFMIHSFAITTKNQNFHAFQPTIVHTHSIMVKNVGKKTANNVRIGHQSLPDFQIHPPVIHTTTRLPDGSAEILIPTLVPGEQITIGYLYFPPVVYSQIHSYCKSDEAAAKILNVIPMTPLNKVQLYTFWLLIFIGASSIIYWIIYLAIYLSQIKSIV